MRIQNSILLASLFLFSIFLSCTNGLQKTENETEEYFHCSAEKIDSAKMQFTEENGEKLFFSNVESRTNDFAFSGNFSCKLTSASPYGFTTELNNINPDDYLKVTVWRKSESGHGVIAIDGGEGFYFADKKIIDKKNGWEKITAEFFVPPHFNSNKIKIYVWNNGNGVVYFDDLKIYHENSKTYPEFDEQTGLHLYIDERDLFTISKKRKNAFVKTVLENNEDDYVQAIVFDGTNFLDADIRLKGDLVDHLQGEKWSFRIKLEDEFSWKNMRTFSIQNPSTRYFLHEWAAHKLFEQEDVLTTRYGFVPVKLNNKSLGIYAWEEHFEKQLVESRNRREGPIIRFDETLFWKTVAETNNSQTNWDIDYVNAAQIIPFKEGKTTGDSLLKKQFIEAQKLLLQFKNFQYPVSKIFDIEKLARYYALLDITQAYHGFTWHNQRYYFNPVTCLLEPVAFDGYIENGIFKRVDEPVLSLINPQKISNLRREELMLLQAFTDDTFNQLYLASLRTYSNPAFLNQFIENYQPEADSLTEIMKQEFPFITFNFNYLANQAGFIRNNLKQIETNIEKIKNEVKTINLEKFQHQYTSEINPELIPFLVHAYYNEENSTIRVLNYHNGQIQVQGTFIENEFPEKFEPAVKLQAYNGILVDSKSVPVESKPFKILFSVNNKLFEADVKSWPLSDELSVRQKTVANNQNLFPDKDTIVLEGENRFNTDVVIPSSKTVLIMPGTKIDLVNGAGFFSWSALKIRGTEENPVTIVSSDRTAQGFNVLRTRNRSEISHTKFEGISNLNRGGWQSPAAVNFYEADVDFEKCIFASNFNCDDALNVVRSDFNVTDCLFENTFADAFDSDFCTGTVYNCIFKNTGNDAIDFSGSQVTISDCEMTEISDKAISGGENSQLTISNCEINKANIGVAAKDLSTLVLNKITMNQTVYGLVAFQKKPEFGPATIIIDDVIMKKNMVFHQIEENSKLELNGRIIHGREKKLAVKLYQ